MAIELKDSKGKVTLTTPRATGGTVDLSNYYTKPQTDEKIAEAVENVSVDLTGYATEEYVDTAISKVDVTEQLKDYAKTDYVDKALAQDIESTVHYVDNNFVTKEDWETVLPTLLTDIPDEYLTDSEAEEKYARITDIPDMSEYAKTEDIPDVSAFQTQEQVIKLIEQYGSDIPNAEGVYY